MTRVYCTYREFWGAADSMMGKGESVFNWELELKTMIYDNNEVWDLDMIPKVYERLKKAIFREGQAGFLHDEPCKCSSEMRPFWDLGFEVQKTEEWLKS